MSQTLVGMLNKLLNSRENGKNKNCPIQYVARQPSSIEQVQYLDIEQRVCRHTENRAMSVGQKITTGGQ